MKYKDEKCPNCGNFVRGQYIPTDGIELLTKGGKSAALAGADALLPGLGTGLDIIFGRTIDKAVDSITEELDTNEEYCFECPRCGHTWKTDVAIARLAIPDAVIEQVREDYISELKGQRPCVSFTIFLLLTLYCIICIIINMDNMTTMTGAAQFVFSFFLTIIFAIPTIIKWNKISAINSQIETIEKLPPRDFLHEHKEMFSQYLKITRK